MSLYSKICTLRYWLNKRIDTFPYTTVDMIYPCRELRYKNTELDIIQVSTFAMLKTPIGYFRFARELCPLDDFKLKSEKIFDVLVDGKINNKDTYVQMKKRFVDCNLKTYMTNVTSSKILDNVLISREHQYILAEETIAKYLNCDSLLTKSEWCKLIINGDIEIYGLLSSVACGVNYNDEICKSYYNDMIMHIEPDVQRQLLNLNLLDLICNEVDHGPNNYMLDLQEEKIRGVCAFDNAHPHAFLPIYNLSFKPYHNQSPIYKNGRIDRPYLDKDWVEQLNRIDLLDLEQSLQQLLSRRQIKACIWRITKLKDILDKDRNIHFLAKNEWTKDTMLKEMNGYGQTYLWCLVNWWQLHNNMRQYCG